MTPEEVKRNLDQAMAHMRELMEKLPDMEEKQRRYKDQMRAIRIRQQFGACDDLAQAIDILEHQDPSTMIESPDLHAQMIKEKREKLADENRRLQEEVKNSSFDSVRDAMISSMDPRELNDLIAELNRYRSDYSYTLKLCHQFDAMMAQD